MGYLKEYVKLYRDNGSPIFTGIIDNSMYVMGYYNQSKINPKEPDLRLYKITDVYKKDCLLSLWLRESESGRNYFAGKKDDVWYIGFIHFNRLDKSDPYLTIYQKT